MSTNEDFIPDDHLDPDSRDPEAPAADAIEQATPANPADAAEVVRARFEVNEYDAVEQAQIVDLEDEYR